MNIALKRLAAIALTAASCSIATAQESGQKLAKETIDLIRLQNDMIVTAVRQKQSKGGADDFRKFILAPIDKLMDRWRTLPVEEQRTFMHCTTGLSEHEWRMRDSFKAEKVLKANSLIQESVARCAKDATKRK